MSAERAIWLVCDECRVEIANRTRNQEPASFPPDRALGGFGAANEVRAAAISQGWSYVQFVDLCPEHRDAGAR